MSGKHGKITSDPFNATYVDLFTSTNPASPSFFGNLSFVLHYPNKTRITCANFVVQTGITSVGSGNSSAPHATGTGSVPSKTPQSFVTVSAAASSAATRAAVIGAGAVGVLAAFALAL